MERWRFGCFSRDGMIRISVADTGHGIADDLHPQIFAPFNRLDAEWSGIEGACIGLALCKRLVTIVGEEIGVESVLGEGSTFWVSFPGASATVRSADNRQVTG